AKHRRDSALSRQGLPPERSLEDALTRWLDEYVPQLKRQHDYESHIRALLPYCSGRALEDAPDTWIEYLEANGHLTNSTHNRRGAVLRRVCNLAFRWGWAQPGIAARIGLRTENAPRHIYLTEPQLQQLLAKCSYRPTRDMMMIVAYSGLRPDEVMKLTQNDILDDCMIVRKSKTGRPRTIPIHPSIRAAVKRLPIAAGSRVLERHFERAREAVGHPEWRIYDLRHTAASWLIQSGAELTTVRDVLGH